MRFAICNEIYQDWPIEEAMAHAARTGYDAIEIAPFTLAPYVTGVPPAERRRIRDLAVRYGIAISGIHWVLVKADGMHLTHPEAAVRERTARYFVDLVDFCSDLGGSVLVVGSPKQRSLMPGVSAEQGWEWAVACFRNAVRRAEDRGVTLCFEPLAPVETDFVNTAAEAIALVQAVASPAMKIILDVKAMCSEAKPIPQIIRDSWPHFAHFHANDRNLKGPGFGDVDFVPIAAALREVGYAGTVSVEVFQFEEGPDLIATRSLSYLRSVFGRSAA
jgi:sugar phosphate isomerase/epimerase